MKLRPLVTAIVLFGVVGCGAAARAAERVDPQEDLRADLFFLAGDSMRGRLTDTEENRATADYHPLAVRADGAEAGRAERLVLSALQPDDGDARRRQRDSTSISRRWRGAPSRASGQEFYPHRFSASGTRQRAGRRSSASASARRTCSTTTTTAT